MPICVSCTTTITNKTPGLKCNGPCGKFYHGKCVDLSKLDVSRFLLPGAYWYCAACRIEEGSKRKSIIAGDDDADSQNSLSTFTVLKDIQANIRSLNDKYETVMESVNFYSNQITTFESIINKLNDKIAVIEKLTKENIELKSEIKNLNSRVEIVEQQARLNNLEIQGVPEKPNENILHILEKIGEHIQCPISASTIDTAHRIAHQSSDRPKPIIVKFITKQKRDEILAAAKVKRLATNDRSPGLKIENISNGLFINEHLTSLTKLILKKSKDMARSKNYKYIWVRNGSVFARKDDRSAVFRITSESDICKIK